MNLYSINTGHFKLDGGAMFGVVPKSLWQKKNPADENNMCSWAMRSLLVETDDNKLILIDNGLGDKQSEKFFGFYDLHGEDSLERSLKKHGFNWEDITDNVLTHLHFDHCGGGIKWNKDCTGYESAFPNATFHVTRGQWDLAMNPNAREKASFLKENIVPMQELRMMKFIENDGELFPGFSVKLVHGHTDAMAIPHINYKGKTLVYMADLIPSAAHVPMPWVMAYDTRPLDTMDEKEIYLNEAADKGHVLFFEHDPVIECATVERTEKGIRIKETFSLEDWVKSF